MKNIKDWLTVLKEDLTFYVAVAVFIIWVVIVSVIGIIGKKILIFLLR